MKENKRTMTPKEYLEEFKYTVTELERQSRQKELFKEWPIDVKYYDDNDEEKPMFTQFAEFFLNYKNGPKKYLDKIEMIDRGEKPYKQTNHLGIQENWNDYTDEKVEAKALFNYFSNQKHNLNDSDIKIIDYEVPLKTSDKDKGVGEIDLLGINNKNLYMLELKRLNNSNSLFHMILEIYTYYRFVNQRKILQEYNCTTLIPAIIFFENSQIHKEIKLQKNEIFFQLMKTLGIESYIIKNSSISYLKDEDIFIKGEKSGDKPLINGDVIIRKFS